MTFDLRRIGMGVLVARWHTTGRQEVEYAAVIADRELFKRYLDADALRFEYVPFYLELRKIFDELLALAP